jgi:hypothetical protein
MTTLKSFLPSGEQFAWDATSITAFITCPRYYQLSILESWEPQNKSVHLLFGGWYAAALEQYFKNIANGMDKEQSLRKVLRDVMFDTWEYDLDESGEIIPDTGKPWESFHNTKTRDTLIRSIVWYFDHFKDDPTETIHLSDGTPAVEYSFALPLDDTYVYCGHMDRVSKYGEGNYIVDQKTSGTTITPRFFDQFSPDNQMSGYAWAGKIIFDVPISGVIVDAVQIAVGFSRYERGFVQRNNAVLEEWHANTMQVIAEASRAHESGNYRMNQTACGNYGGCQFRKVCTRAPEHRDSVLRGEFKRREKRWDPLDRR